MKNYLITFVILLFLHAGCCNDSCITQEACNAKFPPVVMTKEECMTTYGLSEGGSAVACPSCSAAETLKAELSELNATTWINNYKGSMATQTKYGTLIDKCQMCLVSQLAVQELSIYIGKKTSGAASTDFIIIAKYKTADSSVKWADVTDTSDPGGPTCPPGTKCS